ncbi:MAG: cytochrome c maturation protein CcmE [Acidimicrobiia bacterium]|nr:cytochrome c maturation protein CcmE [Acidimicrobiia bacterium]NNC75129.1 cytochrome c maturation protein CcmE [Acidimicrobiia bacterium]
MRRYWRFLIPVTAAVVVIVVALTQLNDNLVFFYTPSEIVNGEISDEENRFRLGGQVASGSVTETADGVSFDVTDGRWEVAVVHSGAPQQLFAEGIGVIVEGSWDGTAFRSDTMLIQHDEQYRTNDGEDYETPADGA